jgi:hypothetical protein
MAHQTSAIQRKQATPRSIGCSMNVDLVGCQVSISRCIVRPSNSSSLDRGSRRALGVTEDTAKFLVRSIFGSSA